MRRMLFLALLLVSGVAKAATYAISTTGSDSADCSTAHPCATISHVRDVVRTHISGGMTDNDIINLRGGTYALSTGVAFTSADSGRDGKRVVWRSYPGEQATISGLETITGWSLHSGSIYKSTVGTDWNFRQLYVNGVHAQRARGSADPAGWTRTATGYTAPSDAMASWGNKTDIEIVNNGIWSMNRCKVATIVGTAVTMGTTCWAEQEQIQSGFAIRATPSWVENAFELLDAAGEWYLDRTAGILYYWPTNGIMTGLTVKAPKVASPITLTNTSNITFANLVFDGSTWLGPDDATGYVTLQAGYQVRDYSTEMALLPGAITVNDGDAVTFSGCTFTHHGTRALLVYGQTDGLTLTGNRFAENAGGDLQVGHVGTAPYGTLPEVRETNATITKNLFAGTQFDYRDQSAVFLPAVSGLLFEGNEIAHTGWSGLAIGWGWSINKAFAVDYIVRRNRIYDTTQLFSDGGNIYTLGYASSTKTGPDGGLYYFDITPPVGSAGQLWYDLSLAPAGFWTHKNATDSRDVRVVTNDGTQIARALNAMEVFGAHTGALYFTAPAGATSFRVSYGSGSATLPAATDTYGRNNAWGSKAVAEWTNDDNSDTQPNLTGGSALTLTSATKNQGGKIFRSIKFVNAGGGAASSVFSHDIYSASFMVWFENIVQQPQYAFNRGTTAAYDAVGLYLNKWIINNGTTVRSAATGPSLNQWYHLVFLRNGNQTKLVVNGSTVLDWATHAITYGDGNVRIGQRGDGQWSIYGYLDEIRAWDNYNLSDAEIATLYANLFTQTGFWTTTAETALDPNDLMAHGGRIENNFLAKGKHYCLYSDEGSSFQALTGNVCQSVPTRWLTTNGINHHITASGNWADIATQYAAGWEVTAATPTAITAGAQPKGRGQTSVICAAGSGCACGNPRWPQWRCYGNNGLPGFTQ